MNDTQSMLELALSGLGIVKLHHYVVEKYLKEGRLEQILIEDFKEEVPLYVVYPQRRYLLSKIRCFIDFVLERKNLFRKI